MKPQMPSKTLVQVPPQTIDVSEYAESLMKSLSETYDDIKRAHMEQHQKQRDEQQGDVKHELAVGDLVLLKTTVKKGQPGRFADRTYEQYFRIKKMVGVNTAVIEDAVEPETQVPTEEDVVNVDRLIKLDLPEVHLQPGPRKLEIQDDRDQELWHPGRVEKMAVDGRVKVRLDREPNVPEWVDLSRRKYRWLTDQVPPGGTRLGKKTRFADEPAEDIN